MKNDKLRDRPAVRPTAVRARNAIRLKSNAVLERKIASWLIRPVGRPSLRPKVFYHGFHYRAGFVTSLE